MRILLMATLLMAACVPVAGAADASSYASDGPRGQTAGGKLGNVEAGWVNSRISSEFSYARNTTVGRDANGKLHVAVSYAMRTANGEETLAGHFSQAASNRQTASNHAQVQVTGTNRLVEVSGGIQPLDDDLSAQLQAIARAMGGTVTATAESSSQRSR